jgi:uncharacterized protein YbaR (Trm112 family)
MHIEFIYLLRCPRPHEETSLVAALYRMNGRVVVEGKLGCHVCGAEYPIRDGIAFFREQESAAALNRASERAGDALLDPGPNTLKVQSRGGRSESSGETSDPAMRIAAFLDLARPGTLALLTGDWANAADTVAVLTSSRIIALNAPSRCVDEERVVQIDSNPPLPLANHSLDGIALDPTFSTGEMLAEASRLLRPHGRLLAASGLELSGQFSELARDADHVVAEYVGDLVSIRR